MANPNIYAMTVMSMHPKIREFINKLNDDGQIDLDQNGHPYLLRVDKISGTGHTVYIKRNNTQENFIIDTRRRSVPLISWKENDNFVRQSAKRVIPLDDEGEPRGERQRRVPFESFERVVDQILKE